MQANNDPLTGLPTLKGWAGGLPEGRFASMGHILSLRLSDLVQINQMYGLAASDILLTQVATLLKNWLSGQQLLVRESRSDAFYLWMPGSSHDETQQLALRLQQSLFASGVMITSGVEIHPRMAVTILPVAAQASVYSVIEELDRMEVREPALEAPTVNNGDSALAMLNVALEHHRTFGLEQLIEQIHASINQQSMKQPQTIFLLAPPPAVKSRTLGVVGSFLGSSNIPMAHVSSHASDRDVSCGLLVAILLALMPSYQPELLFARVLPLCDASPWLCGLFPTLIKHDAAPPPPGNHKLVCDTLTQVLLAMVENYSAIVIINGLNFADNDSISALGALQQRDDHGLLILAGVDPENNVMPALVSPLLSSNTVIITQQPFSKFIIGEYLNNVLPGVKTPELTNLLLERSGGWILDIEGLLRSWAESGALNHDFGKWHLEATTIPAELFSALSPQEKQYLAQAALVCPVTLDFLTTLWKFTNKGITMAIVTHGRAMGLLLPEDPNNPQQVEFRDEEYATQLTELLSQEEVLRIHADIFKLMDGTPTHLPPLQQNQNPLSAFANIIKTQHQGVNYHREEVPEPLPPIRPLEQGELPILIDVLLMIRLVGVGYRYYPPNSEIVREHMESAIAKLAEVFQTRPAISISTDGSKVAIEGRTVDRRDLATPLKDYLAWMNEAHLKTLGIMKGVTTNELKEMFITIAEYDGQNDADPLLEILQGLSLPHIRFIPRQTQMNDASAGTINLPVELAGSLMMNFANNAAPAAYGAPGVAAPANTPFVIPDGKRGLPVSGGGGPAASVALPASPVNALETPRTIPIYNPAFLTADEWAEMPVVMEGANSQARQAMMENLYRWLSHSPEIASKQENVCLDNLLLERLEQEQDSAAMHETARAAMERLQALVRRHEWSQMLSIVESVHNRISNEDDTGLQEEIAAILDSTAQSDEFLQLVNDALKDAEHMDDLRRLIGYSGNITWPILMNTLINSPVLQIRMRVMTLMKEYGPKAMPLLKEELRHPYPWYVYRNLLLAASEIGSPEAMPEIATLLGHIDPRVRSSALNAAMRLGGDGSANIYLLQGLNDNAPEVRAQAASLAGTCRDRAVMAKLIQLLLRGILDKDEPENIQIAATLALGQFEEKEARACLINILSPRIFRRKPDHVRVAAVNALAAHLADPTVQDALKQAAQDRNRTIKIAANRVLQQLKTN